LGTGTADFGKGEADLARAPQILRERSGFRKSTAFVGNGLSDFEKSTANFQQSVSDFGNKSFSDLRTDTAQEESFRFWEERVSLAMSFSDLGTGTADFQQSVSDFGKGTASAVPPRANTDRGFSP
jgi:hypothetical protein